MPKWTSDAIDMDMQTTLTFDPTNPEERRLALQIIESLDGLDPAAATPTLPLRELVAVLLDKEKHSDARKQYAGLVALNCPEPTPSTDVVQVMSQTIDAGKDPNKAVGGTHRSLEQTWKSLGGQVYSPMFITTDASGAHSMDPAVAEAVKAYLIDELMALRESLSK